MDTKTRREEILRILNNTDSAIKGIDFAQKFGVSRQIIVQDIAILRARGIGIMATAQGYIIPKGSQVESIRRTIACNHTGYNQMEEELRIIIDLGGKIIDVIVDHSLYGEIKSPIGLSTRYELSQFMNNIKDTQAEPLSSLTQGLHLHTIEVKDEETFKMIKQALEDKNYIISED